jgi:very-short-patch-repair endonuclease
VDLKVGAVAAAWIAAATFAPAASRIPAKRLSRRPNKRAALPPPPASANTGGTSPASRAGAARSALVDVHRRPGLRKLRQALSNHSVTDSDLERRFLRVAADAGLPAPQTQVVVCGFRVDFFWAELGLVVETDGLTYHRTPAQQAKDRVRDQLLTAAGFTCLRFTNAQIRRSKPEVIRILRAVAARLRSAPGRLAA